MKYQTREEPAPNPRALLDFLVGQEQSGSNYVYRGQVREWPGPLIPSLYRRSIRRNGIFTDQDARFRTLSVRKCGRRFIEMQPDSSMAKLVMDVGRGAVSLEEYTGLMRLSFDPDFSESICRYGHEAAVLKRVHPRQHELAKRHMPVTKILIDEAHRGQIRQLAFLQPFGYALGMTLAQQYGFSSELLDFTSRPDVALFFATHCDPTYTFVPGAAIKARYESDTGIIYRLPSNEGAIKYERLDHFNYYSCPAQVHLSDLCLRFEDKSSPEMMDQLVDEIGVEGQQFLANAAIPIPQFSEFSLTTVERASRQKLSAIGQYLHLYYHGGGIRYYRLLDTPAGSFETSRLGRQAAVAVLPDELREEEPGPDGRNASFQAVEDVSERPGCERFYFRHTEHSSETVSLTREFLWPERDDYFKVLVSQVLDPASERYYFGKHWIPKRLDLVSPGYVRSKPASIA
jgi:hypothetical protein